MNNKQLHTANAEKLEETNFIKKIQDGSYAKNNGFRNRLFFNGNGFEDQLFLACSLEKKTQGIIRRRMEVESNGK